MARIQKIFDLNGDAAEDVGKKMSSQEDGGENGTRCGSSSVELDSGTGQYSKALVFDHN